MTAQRYATRRTGDPYEDDVLGGPDALAPEDDVLGGSDRSPEDLLGGPDVPAVEADILGDEQSIDQDLLASPDMVDFDLLAIAGGRGR